MSFVVIIPVSDPPASLIPEEPIQTGYRSHQEKRDAKRLSRSRRRTNGPHVWGMRNSRDPQFVRQPPGRASRRS
jgi:hypothetical protein